MSRCAEPNPFFEPEFLILCAKHFESYAETTLVVAHESNVFRAALPIIGFEKPRFLPRSIAVTRGRPTAVRLLGTPLVDVSCADAAMGAILDALHRAADTQAWPGIVVMDKLGSDGPVMESLSHMCRARRFPVFTKETWERGMVWRDGKWENPLTRSRRRAIDSKRRALARDAGAEVSLRDRTLDPSVVDDFLRIEVEGWKGREGGLAFAKDAATSAWFRELARPLVGHRTPHCPLLVRRRGAHRHRDSSCVPVPGSFASVGPMTRNTPNMVLVPWCSPPAPGTCLNTQTPCGWTRLRTRTTPSCRRCFLNLAYSRRSTSASEDHWTGVSWHRCPR